jgi:hypothetical protein
MSLLEAPSFRPEMPERELLVALSGWGLAALGIVTLSRSLFGFLGGDVSVNLALGLLGVLLAVGGERAKESFRYAAKSEAV